MNRRPVDQRWHVRHQRLVGISLQAGAVIIGVSLAWWISRPSPMVLDPSSLTTLPASLGPIGSQLCGPSAAPRQSPPIDSPFGVHLFATTHLGVIHPLPAMNIAHSLMPPEVAGRTPAPPVEVVSGGDQGTRPARNETALDDVEAVNQLLQEFRRVFGAMPVGELNDEIVRRLQGENPRGIAVLPKSHPAISSEGELLDRWGTPYRFHPESYWHMTVRSAGPDKRMWTNDDILSTLDGPSAAEGPAMAGIE